MNRQIDEIISKLASLQKRMCFVQEKVRRLHPKDDSLSARDAVDNCLTNTMREIEAAIDILKGIKLEEQ